MKQRRPARRGIASAGAALAFAAAGAHAAIAARAAARALSVDDTGHLHLLHASGSILMEEGPVSGTLPGTTRVRLDVGAGVTASFTIDSRAGGSISGNGSASLHNSSRYSSFGGSLSVSHGTGRYAHAHGVGRLYGVIDRRTDEVTVQAIGTLHY
jgi:hypothetical protein